MSAPNPFQNIPAELRARSEWVNWKMEEDKNGKPTKVPKQPNGANASTTSPRTWSTFERVCQVNGELAGHIGFVFTKEAGFVGIDLDHCRNPKTGETEKWALNIITQLDSYTELSQSGTGWHVIVKGTLPGPGNKVGNLEMYEQKRFFCSTGTIQNGLGRRTIERRDVSTLHKRMLDREFVFNGKAAKEALDDESVEDFRLVAEVHKQTHTADAVALEKAFVEKHPARYAERNSVKGDRAGKNYFRYTIEKFLARVGDEEVVVPRLPITETANAERLVEKHGEEIRFCSDRRVWCAWDGAVWNVDDIGGVARRMQEVSQKIYSEASNTRNESLRKALAGWALRSESRHTQDNSVAIARYFDGIEIREFSSVFDTHPMLLNVKNATIDLLTGELHPHSREDFLTKMVPIEYDLEARCEKFKVFLGEVLPGEGLSTYLWKLAGYLLTGLTSEQQWWLFHGVTASGKSTLINVLHGLLGPYAMALPENYFLVTNNTKDYATATLAGVRLATCVETNEGRRLDVAKLKSLTGEDVISAELKYQNCFSFKPQMKLILATNNKPRVSASDDAIWRRLKLVPFNISVAEEKRIPDLAARLLEEEAPGILRWAVLGAKAWLCGRLGEPRAVKDASQEYRTDEDSTKDFLNDCCVVDGEFETEADKKEFRSAYVKWCKENHVWPMHAVPFGRDLKRLGAVIDVPGRTDQRKWRGIRLRQLGDPEPEITPEGTLSR